jgi:hypothetical protein
LGVEVSINISGNNFRQTVDWNFDFLSYSWEQMGNSIMTSASPLGDIQLNLQKKVNVKIQKSMIECETNSPP